MQSLLKLVLVDDGKNPDAAGREERRQRIRVEDYLEHMTAPLLGIVPYEDRLALRTETEEHLYALIEDREADGLAIRDATETALREYGEPWRIGEQFVAAWCVSHAPETLFVRYMSAATVRAFAFFGTSSVTCLLLLQATNWNPSRHEIMLPLIIPVCIVAPILAGILTGALVPVRPARAVGAAMAIVLAHCAVAATLMWPQHDGLYLLAGEALGWLPAGALFAGIGASATRHLRRTFFLRRWALR